jgi:CBS domain-containing protein
MPTVQDILMTKGRTIFSTAPNTTVIDAVNKMNQHKLGALVVMEGDHVAGIFTERDILRRVLGEDRNPRSTFVGEVMTTDVICCAPDAELDEISAIMQERRVRHIPVCDADGRLQGLISIGDVNAFHASHQEAKISFLNEYIFGRA